MNDGFVPAAPATKKPRQLRVLGTAVAAMHGAATATRR